MQLRRWNFSCFLAPLHLKQSGSECSYMQYFSKVRHYSRYGQEEQLLMPDREQWLASGPGSKRDRPPLCPNQVGSASASPSLARQAAGPLTRKGIVGWLQGYCKEGCGTVTLTSALLLAAALPSEPGSWRVLAAGWEPSSEGSAEERSVCSRYLCGMCWYEVFWYHPSGMCLPCEIVCSHNLTEASLKEEGLKHKEIVPQKPDLLAAVLQLTVNKEYMTRVKAAMLVYLDIMVNPT
ncbi:hypothetical protein UY3_15759 [Chelonia mydas]|uniref:Uncharacterized protein n=1 Tax=Chelonia mydas TaxID=8469 RepID=M7AVT2_CHEMY|nr:hypothetical protein UY3_15759 [Chelonia mydas]